jgi:prepilin-type N-terminal cleavage/methylation domain-containing protein
MAGQRVSSAKRCGVTPKRMLSTQNDNRRAGFTLVEVIVVLVILAILAAIAIPALTGYIDKANDKEWIMKARDLFTAYRAILDINYAEERLSATQMTAIQDGNYETANAKIFYGSLGDSNGWKPRWQVQVYELLGWPIDLSDFRSFTKNAPSPEFSRVGPPSPSTTALNADGFHVGFKYDFTASTKFQSSVVLTYKLNRDDNMTTWAYYQNDFTAVYNSDAGFEIYYTGPNT